MTVIGLSICPGIVSVIVGIGMFADGDGIKIFQQKSPGHYVCVLIISTS